MKANVISLQPDSTFYKERKNDALAYAQRNALRRVVRCLFAENILDKNLLTFTPEKRYAWFPLRYMSSLIFFEDLWAAPADTYINRGPITLIEFSGERTIIETPDQLIDLLRPCFNFSPSEDSIVGLKMDIANSVANDVLARIHREAWAAELNKLVSSAGANGLMDYLHKQASVKDAAMLLDQWGSLEGHPFYPTWKTKPDLSPEEVVSLSPEFNAKVRVRIASLRADMAYIEHMPHVHSYHEWFAANFPAVWDDWKDALNAKRLNERDWLPLPIHSWHLEHYVKKEYAAEVEEGILNLEGPAIETLPTMSFRTMMPQEQAQSSRSAPFIKLPIALWLTSEQRSLQAKSIHMGPRISTVIKSILAADKELGKALDIFPEEVAFYYKHKVKQEDRPGRHLSVVYRASQYAFNRADGLLPVTVAALFTGSSKGGRPLVTELIERGGANPSVKAVETWFREYAQVVTRPVIAIYMLYGIGLEAHQQNTSVLFSADGKPRSLLMRDFGDSRTYAPLLSERGYELKPYVHQGILPTVFSDNIEPVRSFLLDACFVCHLHELALLLTSEYELASSCLWEILRDVTEGAFDAIVSRVSNLFWQEERAAFLERPWTSRSLLRMHLLNYADYRLTHSLSNPIMLVARS